MTQMPTPATETLDELLAETQRYAGYLEKLEERRDGTPPNLYARLHEEYETRLADLRLRAEVEADALAAGLEKDAAAVQDAEARLARVEEERAEGELRAAVGELDPRVWAKRLNGLNAQVTSIGAERDALVAALAHRRTLLEEVQGPHRPIPGVPSDRPPRVSFASPAFGGAVQAPPSAPSAPAPAAGRATPPAEGTGDGKSRKCHDCGTLNFPTEWYCERCGGELAAD